MPRRVSPPGIALAYEAAVADAAGVPQRPRLLPRRPAPAPAGHRGDVRRPRAADRPRPGHGDRRRAERGGDRVAAPSPAPASGCWSSRRSTPTPPSRCATTAPGSSAARSTPTAGTSTSSRAGLRQHAPTLAYLIPDFQNPTGHLMTDAQREEYAAHLRRARTIAVVDEAHQALPLDGQPMPRPFASYAARHHHPRQRQQELLGRPAAGLDPRTARQHGPAHPGARLPRPRRARRSSSWSLAHLLEDPDAGPRPPPRRACASSATRWPPRSAERLPEWRFRVPAGGLALWCELPVDVARRPGRRGRAPRRHRRPRPGLRRGGRAQPLRPRSRGPARSPELRVGRRPARRGLGGRRARATRHEAVTIARHGGLTGVAASECPRAPPAAADEAPGMERARCC